MPAGHHGRRRNPGLQECHRLLCGAVGRNLGLKNPANFNALCSGFTGVSVRSKRRMLDVRVWRNWKNENGETGVVIRGPGKWGLVLALGFVLMLSSCSGLIKTGPRQELVPVSVAGAALDIALTQEGVPYVWGGQDPSGFDGSGLIIWSYQMVDPNLRFRNYRNEIVNDVTQDELWRYNVMRLELSQARPGDIVFITSDSHRITHGGRSRERSGGSGLLGSAGSWRRGHERSGSPCEGKRENSGNYSTYL